MRTIARMTAAAAVVAAVLAPSAGQASIPPSYRIVVISTDNQARARADALVQYMSSHEAFFRAEPTVYRYQFERCLTEADREACLRALMPLKANWQDPPHVVIVAEAEGDSREVLSLSCLRSGTETVGPLRRATVDARIALFGAGPERTAALRAAVDCIQGG